jgi:hypothetical protein
MQADRPTAKIILNVADPQGAAVSNAVIGLLSDPTHIQASGTTNDKGMLMLAGLCAGSYVLEVSAQGFRPHRQTIKLGIRSVSDVAIRLDLAPSKEAVRMGDHTLNTATISGQGTAGIALVVVDPQGAVVARARVQLKGEHDELVARGVTNEAGSVALAGLPDGSHTLEISASGFKTHQESIKTEKGRITNLQIKVDVTADTIVCSPCTEPSLVSIGEPSIEPGPIPYVRVIPLPCDRPASFRRFLRKAIP